jgi:hypothetical protein
MRSGSIDAGAAELSPRRMSVHFALVLAAAALLGGALAGAHTALSAALGVALCGANLFVMRRITRALTAGDGGSAVWALALPVKLIVLVAVAFLLVHTRTALAFPLALGFALLPLTSVFLPRPSSVRGRA